MIHLFNHRLLLLFILRGGEATIGLLIPICIKTYVMDEELGEPWLALIVEH